MISSLVLRHLINPRLRRVSTVSKRYQHDLVKGDKEGLEKVKEDKTPIKFTTSLAHRDYKATENFYSYDPDLPKSHNLVIALTSVFGFIYMFLLRDHVENDGGVNLFRPVYETIPELAIPLLQVSIIENRKFGNDTSKLEAKLAEFMKEPEKYGGGKRNLIEN